MDLVLEIIAVVLNLIYLILLMKEKIACWVFGILGSLVSISLFYSTALYSEAILYVYYVIIGIYGYRLWSGAGEKKLPVRRISLKQNIYIIISGALVALGVGYIFSEHTDAASPYLDALTTVFSFVASFLEAQKIISSWIFWIVINSATVFLFLGQGLFFYLLLTIIYIILSVVGYREWRLKLS